MESNSHTAARQAYRCLCDVLTKKKYVYAANDAERKVGLAFQVKPIPMRYVFCIDEDRQRIRLLSYLPFELSEPKRMDGAAAVCIANHRLDDGNFDFDPQTGRILFRMATSYADGELSEDLIDYMLENAYHAVETYNIRFFALEKGRLTLEQFMEQKA